MERTPILTILCLLGLLIAWLPEKLPAQNQLNRISVHERSDGKGYVFRYHLSEAVDSFAVSQPAPDLIQVMLYSPNLDTLDFIHPDQSPAYNHIDYHKNTEGFGFDIFLDKEMFVKTAAYPDRNSNDMLVALEYTTEDEITKITDETDFIYWHDFKERQTTEFMRGEDEATVPIRDGREFNTIVIDAGHGGHDPGSMNRRLGLQEKDIALEVAFRVGNYIKEHIPDMEVIYTREDDTFVPLDKRGLIATRAKADLFLSIHLNAVNDSRAYGSEVFFLGMHRSESALEIMKRENSVVNLEENGGQEQLSEEELLIYELANAGNIAVSERIAAMIENQFRNRAQRRSRGVKQAGLMVLWHASTPAILVELGFLSNPNEARYMNSEYGQTILASAIFRAIRNFKAEYDRSIDQASTASNE
ncbi:MAG: N-acetylmuramoyl-L-alanine amidase [Balneolaceae bacterium]|nr:N-acetylmuramoyl-L-alanine amidase [Balneolaceae bacterium]